MPFLFLVSPYLSMTILTDSEKSRLQQIISKTTGPAPWYWKNFPALKSATGKEYEWVHHGEEGQLAHLVTLHEAGNRNDPLLALNIYCTPFEIGEGRLGIWCPEGRNMVRVAAFDLDGLKPFVLKKRWAGSNNRPNASSPRLSLPPILSFPRS